VDQAQQPRATSAGPHTSCFDMSFSLADSSVTDSSRAIYITDSQYRHASGREPKLNNDDRTSCP
jgi:hypothetical protein